MWRALLKIFYDDDVYGANIIAEKNAAGNRNGGGEIENVGHFSRIRKKAKKVVIFKKLISLKQ